MIVYFADRNMNVLGQASTSLPDGLIISDDVMTVDVETGTAIFECKIPYNEETRALVTACAEVGNYLLRSGAGENEFYQIIDAEIDTKKQQIYIYAEDEGMDLLNEIVGEYEADKAYPISHYINKFAGNAGFVIGTNEIADQTRKLSWDDEQTAQARLLNTATQFDCEIAFSFDVTGLYVVKKYINIYKKRGEDTGITLRLNYEVDSIVTTKSIANLATALTVTGGTPEKAENPITLKGYAYDDGDIYNDNGVLRSREALKKWARLLWKDDDGNYKSGGHITRAFTYDTVSQAELCTKAVEELKKICDVEVNYEADITEFPQNVKAGDRVNIVDDAGELYLSTRLLTIERSVTNGTNKAVLGEYLLKSSGINQKVIELAQQFAKNAHSTAKALSLANTAQEAANEALEQVEDALASVEEAERVVQEVVGVVDEAKAAAAEAQQAAQNAQNVVDNIETDIAEMEQSIVNAEAAAQQAKEAAQNAETKATEAKTAAANAQTMVNEQVAAVRTAQNKANEAQEKATEAMTAAQAAQSEAQAAATTAEAAKLDAKTAQDEINSLGDNITTLEDTISVEYARKTELTEAEAYLQSQITRNATQLSSTMASVERIDETTNNSLEQLEGAIKWAEITQEQADQAQANAEAAQTAADEAERIVAQAQAEANTAQTAADEARAVADEAKIALETAIADFETISSRADATEEEIEQARAVVVAAQTAADNATAASKAAISQAQEAQTIADRAHAEMTAAQANAQEALNIATLAQLAADEAKGNATEAVRVANEAAEQAAAALEIANNAISEAEAAQDAAAAAQTNAQTAQRTANDAQTKADQAASDLAAAQSRLEELQADAGATEAELEAAQAAVTKAQTEAAAAQNAATVAQTAANEAKTQAEAAQTAADNAQAEADQAQAESEAAQEAVSKAQGVVYGLSERITNTESKITQSSKEIKLSVKNQINVTQNTADNALQRVTIAESDILQLADMIATLVTDGNGASLMTQTQSGWSFNIGNIIDSLSKANEDIGNLSGEMDGANSNIDALQKAVNDLGVLNAYVVITTYNGQPCIELGQTDSGFKLRITNTEIQFADGSVIPAYITNKKLMIEQAEVKDELQFGSFVWKARENGNMGLVWKGGAN